MRNLPKPFPTVDLKAMVVDAKTKCCWECLLPLGDNNFHSCDDEECERGIHNECLLRVFVDEDGKYSGSELYCNTHFPHVCGWCDAVKPTIQCVLCSDEAIKQYICEPCFSANGCESVCKLCDDAEGVDDYDSDQSMNDYDEDDDDWCEDADVSGDDALSSWGENWWEGDDDDVAAPFDDVAAPFDDVAAPFDDVAAPFDDVAAPFDEAAAPFDEAVAPFDEAVAPFDDVVALFDDVVAPFDEAGRVMGSRIAGEDQGINQHRPPVDFPEPEDEDIIPISSRINTTVAEWEPDLFQSRTIDNFFDFDKTFFDDMF